MHWRRSITTVINYTTKHDWLTECTRGWYSGWQTRSITYTTGWSRFGVAPRAVWGLCHSNSSTSLPHRHPHISHWLVCNRHVYHVFVSADLCRRQSSGCCSASELWSFLVQTYHCIIELLLYALKHWLPLYSYLLLLWNLVCFDLTSLVKYPMICSGSVTNQRLASLPHWQDCPHCCHPVQTAML